MSDERIFGPDRNDPPGITPVPHRATPPQLVEWSTESCAIHSKSQGWLPAVSIALATEDGAGITAMIPVGPDLDHIINGLREASRAARRDVAMAIRRGDLPSTNESDQT